MISAPTTSAVLIPEKVKILLIGLAIVMLAGLLRLPFLDAHGYMLDECWTAELACGNGSVHLNLPKNTVLDAPDPYRLGNAGPWWRVWTKLECTHPPLYFVTLRLWMNLTGQGDARERMLSVLLSLVSVALLYDAARILNGRTVAIWAGVLMAVATPQVEYARETRNYAMLLAAALLAVDALVRLEIRGPNWKRWLALTIGILATLLTHYFGAGAVAAMGLYALIRLKGRMRGKAILCFIAACLLFAICWGPFMWQQRQLFSTVDQSTLFLRSEPAGHLQRTLLRLMLLPGALLAESQGEINKLWFVAAAVYLIPLFAFRRRANLLFWYLWFGLIVAAVAMLDLGRQTRHLNYIRYTLAAGPAIYVLLPAMLEGLQRFRWVSRGLLAVIALLCLAGLREAYQASITDPAVITSVVSSEVAPVDLIAFIGAGDNRWWAGSEFLVVSRYLRPIPCPIVLLNEPATGAALKKALSARHVYAFTDTEYAVAFFPGTTDLSSQSYPAQGKLWELAGSTPP